MIHLDKNFHDIFNQSVCLLRIRDVFDREFRKAHIIYNHTHFDNKLSFSLRKRSRV